MGTILQLDPPILVKTPLGTGDAIFIIDYGIHQNTCWIVALQKNGVIKHFDCNDVILAPNFTYKLNVSKEDLNGRSEKSNGVSSNHVNE
jgi:hypothetical protein